MAQKVQMVQAKTWQQEPFGTSCAGQIWVLFEKVQVQQQVQRQVQACHR